MEKGGGGGGGGGGGTNLMKVVKPKKINLLMMCCGVGNQNHRNINQHCHLFDQISRIMLLFSAMALICLLLYNSAYTFRFISTSLYVINPSSSALRNLSSFICFLRSCHCLAGTSLPGVNRCLELKFWNPTAAMVDKTVIITTLNEAWAKPNSIFELFLESFQNGKQTRRLLNHLVVIALDQKAFARCLELHPHCYALSTPGVNFSGEAYFMTADYLKMVWRRIDFLRNVLQIGYNFVYTDADIMWFRDPFLHFYSGSDFQIASDYYHGNSFDLKNMPNSGFNYVKSSNRTIEFYKFWYTSREKYPGQRTQEVFNVIKFDSFIRKIGLQIRYLDTAYFGGFCQPSRDFNLVCTMHANCCLGLDNKTFDLRVMLEDWRKYTISSEKNTTAATQKSTWTVPQRCR